MRQILSVFLVIASLAACGGGSGNPGPVFVPPPVGPPATTIAEVQGNSASSPLVGQDVSISGVVTGDFQDNDADTAHNLSGFFVQQEVGDGDTATSDGVFVFDGSSPETDVNVGDSVTVEGSVNENFAETRIAATTVTVTGNGNVQPTDVSLPVGATVINADGMTVGDLEQYEGMLLRFPQTLTVTTLTELEAFGSIGLAEGPRSFQFTNMNPPNASGYAAFQLEMAARSIILDADAAPGDAIRSGDSTNGVVGVLRYARGDGSAGAEAYRLAPTAAITISADNPRPVAPALAGQLRIAAYNVHNFFTTIDSGQSVCSPGGNRACRGADSAEEYQRQLAKIITSLRMIDADIVGMMELENNGGTSLQAIVDGLNALGNDSYDSVDTGPVGSGATVNGFIFKTATVVPNSTVVILDSSIDARFDSTRHRPSVAQSFMQLSDNAVVNIVVNHLKSKVGSCDSIGDPDLLDGQGECNATRTAGAEALIDWIATDPTGSGDSDYLVIGDLNALVMEDPLTSFKNAGFTSLVETSSGGSGYTFVFQGLPGALDHVLASASLAPQVVDFLEWHINSDETEALDYNLEGGRDPSLFDPTMPSRASDHDPLIVGIDLSI